MPETGQLGLRTRAFRKGQLWRLKERCLAERGSVWKRKADYWIGIPLVTVGAMWRCLERSQRKETAPPSRIGLLCIGAIGDLILATTTVNALHRRWPEAQITLLTSQANAHASVFVPYVSESRAFAVTNVLKIIQYVRSCRFDLFVDTGQWARVGALISAFSRANCTAGFRTHGQHRHGAFDIAVPHCADRHEVENYQNLGLMAAGVTDTCDTTTFTASELLRPDPALPQDVFDFAQGAPLVACHMFPSGIHAEVKEWPPEHWIALTELLTSAGIRILFTGGRGDMDRVHVFLKQGLRPAIRRQVLCVAGRFSLWEEAAMLQKIDALVSVNTGYMHLAALLGVPTVDLHGPTNPRRWGGIGPRVISLLPEKGKCAYLNLGFEYPREVEHVLQYLSPRAVIRALRGFGTPFDALVFTEEHVSRTLLRGHCAAQLSRTYGKTVMKPFDKDTFMRNVRREADTTAYYKTFDWRSLPAVLRLRGEAFIKAAYWLVLGRKADAVGLVDYAPRSTRLPGKLRLLLTLALSSECGLFPALTKAVRDKAHELGEQLSKQVKQLSKQVKQSSRRVPVAWRTRRDMDGFYVAFENHYRHDFDTICAQLETRYRTILTEDCLAGERALDLGCGRGEAVAFMHTLGFQASGVDSNRIAVKSAQCRGLDVHHGDLFAYLRSIPDDTLAVVTAFHVIEHLSFKHVWDLVDEAWRVLQPGGLLVFETPNIRNLLVSSGDFYRDPTHIQHIFPDTLDFLLNREGFEGTAYFFSEDQQLLPYTKARLDEIQDYFYVSRDMAWIGRKTAEKRRG